MVWLDHLNETAYSHIMCLQVPTKGVGAESAVRPECDLHLQTSTDCTSATYTFIISVSLATTIRVTITFSVRRLITIMPVVMSARQVSVGRRQSVDG